jgi:CubicO group peptidase (beta-lactamase class C family)
MRRHIFGRAGMSQTDFIDLDDVTPNVAEGYIPVKNESGVRIGWRRNIYSTTAGGAADGGETSTLDDLARFLRALRDGKLTSKELAMSMLTPTVETGYGAPGSMYGFGCFILMDEKSRVVRWGHTGEEDGISCRLYYYPMHKLDVVILGNQTACAGKLLADIHDLILDDE